MIFYLIWNRYKITNIPDIPPSHIFLSKPEKSLARSTTLLELIIRSSYLNLIISFVKSRRAVPVIVASAPTTKLWRHIWYASSALSKSACVIATHWLLWVLILKKSSFSKVPETCFNSKLCQFFPVKVTH